MMLLDFDTTRDLLLRHLPRPARDMPIQLDQHGLFIDAQGPGVPVGDLVALLADLFGNEAVLPEGFVPRGVKIESLALVPHEGTFGADFEFAVVWEDMTASFGDGFPLTMARIAFRKHGQRMLGTAEATFEIDGLVLDVHLELPSQVIRGSLKEAQSEDAQGMLARRGLLPEGARLRSLELDAALLYDAYDLHIELEHLISFGAVHIEEVIGSLSLTQDAVEAEVFATLTIEDSPITFTIDGAVSPEGWRLEGALEAEDHGIKAKDILSHLGSEVALPDVIAEAGLTHLGAAIDTAEGRVAFDLSLHWPNDADLRLAIEKTDAHVHITGTLALQDLVFALNFDAGEAQLLLATLEPADHAALRLDDLLRAVAGERAVFPGSQGLELEFKSLALALDGDGKVVLGGDVRAGVDLGAMGDLPLLGALLPKDASFGLSFAPLYVEEGFAALSPLKPLMPGDPVWPDPPGAGFRLGARLDLAGLEQPLPDVTSPDAGTSAAQARRSDVATTQTSADPLPGVDIAWNDIDADLGPLHISRVGVGIAAPLLDLAIDAELTLGGLSVSVMGLGARYDFDSRDLTPRLEGLGLGIEAGTINIGGSFLNLDGDFAGQVRIETEPFSLSALGAFTMLGDTPSMFVFGALDMPLGGPVFFFVDGLAAGFGLHRALTLPKIDDLRSFPLIASAAAVADGVAEDMSAQTQISRLHEYIQPKLGAHFLAAGIKFNSFRLLKGYAVVIVSFGDALEVDLLGTADFVSPPDLPAGMPAMARIGLNLVARFQPDEGRLRVEAKLTPQSYIYGPLCHLSGGFAFYAWTKGRRAGDFVLSLGGYHPDFQPPDDYPVVPRLTLKYQVNDEVFLKGSAYFAMTPSVMMAGGALHAQVNIDALKAWADLSVDFIMAWEPFHYDAHVHLEIGAKWKCFHTTAAADLHIWGPPFSGTAQVDWSAFSFDVQFGAEKPKRKRAISAKAFTRSFLQITETPGSADAMLGIQPKAGLVGQVGETAVVSSAELGVDLSTRIPVRQVQLGDRTVFLNDDPCGVAPMGKVELGASTFTVRVIADADGSDASSSFALDVSFTGMPAALWGDRVDVGLNAPMVQGISEVHLRPAERSEPGATVAQKASLLWGQPRISIDHKRHEFFGHFGPLPKDLPEDDLRALGLDPKDLEPLVGAGPTERI